MQPKHSFFILMPYPAHTVQPGKGCERKDCSEDTFKQFGNLDMSLAQEQSEEHLIENIFVVLPESRNRMCGLDGAVNIATIKAMFDSGKCVLEALPVRPDADVKTVVA